MTFDASALIGFFESTDAHHQRAVSEVGRWLGPEHTRFMSVATYAEILVHPIREGADSLVEEFVERSEIRLVPMDRQLARSAAELRARFLAISLGDAAALATAKRFDTELLTFDGQLDLAAGRTL